MSGFKDLKQKRDSRVGKLQHASSPSSGTSGTQSQERSTSTPNPSVVPSFALKAESSTSDQTVQAQPIGPAPYDIDGLYASLPTTLDVRTDPTSGRGIYNKISRKPGEVLLTVKPSVVTLSNAHLKDHCSNCCGLGGALKRCTGCKTVFYCDSKCQTADWKIHKRECVSLQQWETAAVSAEETKGTVPGDAIRCLARILWRKSDLGQTSVWAMEMDAMQSHRTSLSKDAGNQDAETHAQLAHAVVRFLGLNSIEDLQTFGLGTIADLVDLISRFTTNTFTVTTPSLSPLGACVSPLVALINHSCDPNAVVVFPRAGPKDKEPIMHVVAIKPILPDEEVLTSYIETTLPREKRQRILKETYHFSCRCSLCSLSPDAPPDLREAMWCPKRCGGICPLPMDEHSLVRCKKCGSPVKDTEAVADAIRIGDEAFNKAQALQLSNPQKSLQLTSNLIPILISANLVPSAHPLLGLSTLNTSLLIEDLPYQSADVEQISTAMDVDDGSARLSPQQRAQDALDDTIRSATRSTYALAQILIEGHPVRGVAFAELGKLLAVDEPLPKHLSAPGGGETSPGRSPTPSLSPQAFAMSPNVQNAVYPPSGPPRLKMAYEILLRARAELMIGFGTKNEGGEVGRDVRKLLADVEKELAVWKEGIRNAWQDHLGAGSSKAESSPK